MADEKLPEYVEEALREARRAHYGCLNDEISDIESAIHRYAREREAAALERAAKVCDGWREIAGTLDNSALTTGAMAVVAKAIRALIHKEPANG